MVVRWNPRVENICGAQWYPTTRTYASYEHCGPTCRVFPIMIFYQKLTVSRSFELIHKVLKKTKMFAGTFPKATVTGSTAAALGQRANVHTAVLGKCTHILPVLGKQYAYSFELVWANVHTAVLALGKCTHSWLNLASQGDVASVWRDTIVAASFWAPRRSNSKYAYIQVLI